MRHTLLRLCTTAVILLQFWGNTEGSSTISHAGVTLVCDGDQLELTCNVTGDFLEWRFDLISGNETVPMKYTHSRVLSTSSGPSGLLIHSSIFSFSRTSARRSLPLMSVLDINPVTESLNGTRVNCIDRETQHSSSTVIITINGHNMTQEFSRKVNVTEQLERDYVILTLNWTQESALVSYYVSVFPSLEISFVGVTNIQLIVPYKIQYNVSITAVHACGQNYSMANLFELYYVKCRNPLDEVDSDSINLKIIGYSELIMIGTSVTFTCPPGMILTGPNSSICMENGEWEPNPRVINCIQELVAQDVDDSFKKIAIVSTVTLFAVIATIVFFLTGFLGVCYYQKSKAKQASDKTLSDADAQELELKPKFMHC